MNLDTPSSGFELDRVKTLFGESKAEVYRRTDRLFARLLLFQWIAGIVAAVWISPYTWIGAARQTHWHIWAAVFLGGAIISFPVFLAWRHPGLALTRHAIAAAQMLSSALLIHLTGGRIETHFHVFGSLAFLAFYRDWRVLTTATLVVAVDHLARGLFWPQSVFGTLTASSWRWLEHAAWVLFEDLFLFISVRQSLREMFDVAERRARLEWINADIEQRVMDRTAELTVAHRQLQLSEQRFRTLCASAPIGIFLTDAAGGGLYTNPEWQKTAGLDAEQGLGEGWRQAIHPNDTPRVLTAWETATKEGRSFAQEFRFRKASGEDRWVNARSVAIQSEQGKITGHVGTVEDITDRKRAEEQLEQAQRNLLEVSRRAGMAEMATGVLHNIGNVLNSVNIASCCLAEGVRNSKTANFTKVMAMIRAHDADLGAYFTQDPKGKQLPGYLTQLAEHLTGEQTQALVELAELQKSIEHIKEIVTMQQTYARVSGVTETVKVAELVEDTLRMNAGAFTRHEVAVVREFAPNLPDIIVEKHKVLQILVNLVRNAKHACDASGRKDKQMTVRLCNGDNRIKVSVIDNGVGIPTENLTRIFSHGFTTKTDGHGFGLHSGALAAKELGGSLHVHSDGPGHGATFTLELPVQAPPSRS